MSLVATGSKDFNIKLWDPRQSEAITTIYAHKVGCQLDTALPIPQLSVVRRRKGTMEPERSVADLGKSRSAHQNDGR